MPPSPCLSEECVAELVEGRLAGEALAAAEQHLVSCNSCRSLVTSMADAVGSTVPGEEQADAPPSSKDPPILKKNDRVARYVIQELVGAGGMGRVYAAHDPALDRKVALKVLRPEVAVPDLESRLLREAKAMARITHPHVIAVHDAGRHEGQVYIAMEFVSGGTLREWIAKEPHSWREILEVYLQAGRGLAEAHAASIIHRDFKPDNVLIGDHGKVVRVTDFGLARSSEEPQSIAEADTVLQSEDRSSLTSSLTRTGALVGTPVYMAPEQHTGGLADARSDIFSYCVALYEALYGERPFAGTNLAGLTAAKLTDRVKPPPDGKNIPKRVRKLLLSGLRAKPWERPASMDALLNALERATRRRRAPYVAAAAVAAGGAAWLLYGAGARGVGPAHGPKPTASAMAAAALPVCSNKACVESHGGEPWICRPSDHVCVPIASEECTPYYEPGDLEAEDTIWLGALFPTTGDLAGDLRSDIDASNLARKEFAHATRALTGPNASLHVKRIALTVCNDAESEGAMRGAKHLVDDVGVPAIYGFRSAQEVIDLTGSLLIQRQVVAVASLTSSPLITQIPQPAELPRMVWRTTFSFTGVAVATAAFIHDYFEPRRSKSHGPTKVVLVRGEAPGRVAFGQALLRALVFNGKSGIENRDAYQEVGVPEGAAPEVTDDDVARITKRVLLIAPDFIVLQGRTEAEVRIATAIEAGWKANVPRPVYVLGGDTPESYTNFLGSNPDRRGRLFAAVSSSSSAANAHFVIRYNEAYENHVTRTDNPGSSYDAFYMLAFGANAVGSERVTGPVLAGAFGKLLPPGRPIEVGPTQVFEGLAELSHGQHIDLEGTAATLDFDVATGESRFDFALLCAPPGRGGSVPGESIESGVMFRAKTQSVEGTLHCR